ncbi:hypothetical protein K523DRAFT_311988 [Schizophyllum commune Tattone D]|nr:hypothetical protein K523DRAFT_311988 [Schizophyllum commune Tattone D]
MIEYMDATIKETDSQKQAKRLDMLSQPQTWRRAFRAMDTKYLPDVRPGTRNQFTLPVGNALEALQAFSATLIQYEDTQDPAIHRVMFFGFHLLWNTAWTWIKFLDPLSGTLDQSGMQRFFISITIPAILPTALSLVLLENDPQTIAMMQEEPLECYLAQWYHDYGVDPSDQELARIMRMHAEPVFTRTKLMQDMMKEFLVPECPYYNRMVQVLHILCGGRPERIRRRLLANLEEDLYSPYLVKDEKLLQTYIRPIILVLDVPSYDLKPVSGRTVRRLSGTLYRLSQSPKTTLRAILIYILIAALHEKQPGERIIAIAIAGGLLPALKNIVSYMPLVDRGWVRECTQVIGDCIDGVRLSLRVRRVTRSLVHVEDDLRLAARPPEKDFALAWAALLHTKGGHTVAWNSYKRRIALLRVCFNLKCPLEREAQVKTCICKEAYYCSRECQRADWRLRHRMICAGQRAECDLVLEDRIFLEELTSVFVAAEKATINIKLQDTEVQDKLLNGHDLEIRVRFDENRPEVGMKMETVEKQPEVEDKGNLLYPVAEITYKGLMYILRLDPLPLKPIHYDEPRDEKKRAPFSWIR